MGSSSDSITPNTVIYIILLNELNEGSDIEINQSLSKFLIDRILSQKIWRNFKDFLEDAEKDIKTAYLAKIVRERIAQLRGFNDINKYMDQSVKNLKLWNCKTEEVGKPKVCQGSVVDLFIRKTWLNINKMAFSDLVNFYNDYQKFFFYGSEQPERTSKGTLIPDKIYLDASSKIDNFSHSLGFEKIENEIERIKSDSTKVKISYLEYLNASQHHKTELAVENLHKFFDQNLKFLFSMDRSEANTNKVGQAILNLTNVNLKDGNYDEALRGIGEALRIAQNNADEESINYCLIYLYNIAGVLGLYKDEIMLTEHAISHAMNLNHPLLMLYSSIYYAQFEKLYETTHKDTEYLKSKNISWTEALNFASKKIYSYYENSVFQNRLKDSQITYIIPFILNRLIKGLNFLNLNQPRLLELEMLSTRENYEAFMFSNKAVEITVDAAYRLISWDPLQALKLFRQYESTTKNKDSSKFKCYFIAANIQLCLHRNEYISAQNLEKDLYKLLESKAVEPSIISLVWSLKNQRLIRQGLFAEAYNSCLCLVHYNKTHGFTKQHLIQEYLNLAKIYKLTGEKGKALLQIQKCIEASKTKDPELYIQSLIEKALILTEFNNAYDGLTALMEIDEGSLANFNSRLMASYYYAKGIVFCYLGASIESDLKIDLTDQILTNLNKALEMFIRLSYLNECRDIYYIQARIYNDTENYKHREGSSQLFLFTEKLIGKFEGIKEIRHFDLTDKNLIDYQEKCLDLIANSLKVINVSL